MCVFNHAQAQKNKLDYLQNSDNRITLFINFTWILSRHGVSNLLFSFSFFF